MSHSMGQVEDFPGFFRQMSQKLGHLAGQQIPRVSAWGWWRNGEKSFEGIFLPEKTFAHFAKVYSKGYCFRRRVRVEMMMLIRGLMRLKKQKGR